MLLALVNCAITPWLAQNDLRYRTSPALQIPASSAYRGLASRAEQGLSVLRPIRQVWSRFYRPFNLYNNE